MRIRTVWRVLFLMILIGGEGTGIRAAVDGAPEAGKPLLTAVVSTTQTLAVIFPRVRVDPQTRHKLDDYAYREQGCPGATHVLGTIHEPVTWTREKSPYVMDDNVFVAGDGLLAIGPGVTVYVTHHTLPNHRFALANIELVVEGRLEAEGSPEAMIHFLPPYAWGNHQRHWAGIKFVSKAAPSILKWAEVDGGGVHCEQGPVLVAHCVLRGDLFGLELWRDFSGVAIHNVCTGNCYGIRLETKHPEVAIYNNILWGNERMGLEVGGDSPWVDHNLIQSPGELDRDVNQGEPGPHDLHVDPLFVNVAAGDCRLGEKSPARKRGMGNADLGLASESWSSRAAQEENERWLSGGGRQLWAEGLALEKEKPTQALQNFEAALAKPLDADLCDLVHLALGRTLNALGESEPAAHYLRRVLKASVNPQRRDLARRLLAEALAGLGRTAEGMALLDQLEWPASKVWAIDARAWVALRGGDVPLAIATLEKEREQMPLRFHGTLVTMIYEARREKHLEQAAALCAGLDLFPAFQETSWARMAAACTCMYAGKRDLADPIFKRVVETDPLSEDAAQALTCLAESASQRNRPEEAKQYRERLCRDFYLFSPDVIKARGAVDIKPDPPRKMVLLDASQGENWPIMRDPWGNSDNGVYETMMTLSGAGYRVHSNARMGNPKLNELRYYGLMIIYGRGVDQERMSREFINDVTAYVNEGGNVMVSVVGPQVWEAKQVGYFNPLLKAFGLSFREQTRIPWDRVTCQATTHTAVRGVKEMVALGAVQVEGAGDVLGTWHGEPVVVMKPVGKGHIVAAGLGLDWMANGMRYTPKAREDWVNPNSKFLRAVADWLLAQAPAEVPSRPLPGEKPKPEMK